MRTLLATLLLLCVAVPTSAQRGLPAAPRARSVGQGVRELSVNLAPWSYPAFVLSFNRHLAVPWDRVVSVPQGTEVDADLWVEPRDPEIDALGRTFEGYRRQGENVRVALVLPRERSTGSASAGRVARLMRTEWPDERAFGSGLDASSIGPGTLFAVETNTGVSYLVLITQMSATRITLRYVEVAFGC